MKTFLEYVAEDLIGRFGTDLSRVAVVFPNKRASLWLSDHLAHLARKPLWSPAYITISELFRRHSDRQVADGIKLVCDLYRSFMSLTGTDETLDHFYGWGQLLLSDFDDLDKNMADAQKVFANVRDLHELDDVSYLSDEQKQVIRQFFSNFSDDHNTRLKERFMALWSHIGDIYTDFNRRLAEQHLAYEGALYREVALRDDLQFDYDCYVFVGFNLLQRVEQRLFTMLKKQERALFYWDFDHYYMPAPDDPLHNEAGHYIAQYLADFPNALDNRDADIYDSFRRQKQLTFVSASTENVQARYVSRWLKEGQRLADGRRTAIVLCDEALLTTVTHCLPDEVQSVNITTGYPLAHTPVAALIAQLVALQTSGYDVQRERFRLRQVCNVLRHPYVASLSDESHRLLTLLTERKIYYPSPQQLHRDEATTLLFTPTDGHAQLLGWLCEVVQLIARASANSNGGADAPANSEGATDAEQRDDTIAAESLFRAYTLLNRLLGLVESGDLTVDISTLQRLITQLVQTTTIPFHGEPAEGLQVMGVLETRNLDFDHVLLLSCNEGNMPRGVSDTSFIPYSIRKAYGLTTIDHKVSIYSYYFHRLLQRAHDVTIAYNNATTDGHTGEMSRFMLQLMVESPHHISFQTLHAGQAFSPFSPKPKPKTPDVMERLRQRFEGKLLSPTSINRYQRCPLQFYYNYAEGLTEPDDNEDDTIDNRIFGNIFHEAARIVYSRIMQRNPDVTATDIDRVLNDDAELARAVDEAFRTELFHITDPHAHFHPELNGLQLINREVIIHYLRLLLQVDRRLVPFTILSLEEDVTAPLQIGEWQTTIGGRIDRMDMVGGRIRVIDYKTGSRRIKPLADVDAIFAQESLKDHSDYYLQTFAYSAIVSQQRQQPVSPALIFIQHAAVDDYDPTLCFGRDPITDVAPFRQRFSELLRQTINEMFDPTRDFVPTDERSRCDTCPYKLLCGG